MLNKNEPLSPKSSPVIDLDPDNRRPSKALPATAAGTKEVKEEKEEKEEKDNAAEKPGTETQSKYVNYLLMDAFLSFIYSMMINVGFLGMLFQHVISFTPFMSPKSVSLLRKMLLRHHPRMGTVR